MILVERIEFSLILLQCTLRTEDVLPVIASLPPKINVGLLEAKIPNSKAASRLVRPRPGPLVGGGCRSVSNESQMAGNRASAVRMRTE